MYNRYIKTYILQDKISDVGCVSFYQKKNHSCLFSPWIRWELSQFLWNLSNHCWREVSFCKSVLRIFIVVFDLKKNPSDPPPPPIDTLFQILSFLVWPFSSSITPTPIQLKNYGFALLLLWFLCPDLFLFFAIPVLNWSSIQLHHHLITRCGYFKFATMISLILFEM